jgi:hypothetical protein
MKRLNFKYLTTVIFLLTFFLNSCDVKELDKTPSEVSSKVSVLEAKVWFNQKFSNANSRSASNDKFVLRSVVWELAQERNIGPLAILVVPLIHFKKDKKDGYKEGWFYKDRNNNTTFRVVEYLTSWDKKNRHENIRTNFTGLMLIRDWDNNFIGGFELKDQKVVTAISEFNGEKRKVVTSKKARIQSGQVCVLSETCSYNNFYVIVHGIAGEVTTEFVGCTYDISCYWSETLDTGFIIVTAIMSGQPNSSTIYDSYDPAVNVLMSGDFCAIQKRVQELSRFLMREMNGIMTTDGLFIVLPSSGNHLTDSEWSEVYSNVLIGGIPHMAILDLFNKTLTTYPSGYSGVTNVFNIASTFHSHPCPYGDIIFPSTPSPTDYSFAQSYPSLIHAIWGCDQITYYNPNNITSTQPRCP